MVLLSLTLAAYGRSVSEQPPSPATDSAAGANRPVPTPGLTKLAPSAIALTGPWKFHPGDSPIDKSSGTLLWATPALDDRSWTNLSLQGKEDASDPTIDSLEYLPGWTAQGFPRLTGYAWYRLHLKLSAPEAPILLKMPGEVDDAYQVYANGVYVGEFGHFTSQAVATYVSRADSFRLPPSSDDGDLVLALRFYMNPDTPLFEPSVGGMHEAPVIGLGPVVHLMQISDDHELFRSKLSAIFTFALLSVAAAAAYWVFLLNRSDHTFLWLSLAFAATAAFALTISVHVFTLLLRDPWGPFLIRVLFEPLILPCWTFFWVHWFAQKETRGLARSIVSLTLLEMISYACLRRPLYGHFIPVGWTALFTPLTVVCRAALGLILLLVVVRGIRKNRIEGLFALFPVILMAVSLFGTDLLLKFGLRTTFSNLGLSIDLNTISTALLVMVVGILVVRRLLAMRVEQRAMHFELQQASVLQHSVLLPDLLPPHSRFIVETEYHPAQIVGGDFFQVLSAADGSLLLVTGDISGKGITAAMLVAVVVGAIRTEFAHTCQPARILDVLNERVYGRTHGGFATCLAAHLLPDGTVHIANAGHLPPYLNGRAVSIPAALPLGIVSPVRHETHTLQVGPMDRLTFVSDGVIEAKNAQGKMLGFDSVEQMSTQSAASIAQAARDFGQEDDITVLTVQFA